MRPEAWKPRWRTPLFSVGALRECESRVMVDWLSVLLVALSFLLGIFLRLVFRSSAWDIFCLLYGFWFGFRDMSGLVLVSVFWFFSSRLFWFQVFLIAFWFRLFLSRSFLFRLFRFPA